MTAPKPQRSLDDIVDDIVQEMGGARGEHLRMWAGKPDADPFRETRAEVLRVIRDSNEFFDRWNEFHCREGRASIARDAQELADLIEKLLSKLKRIADPLEAYLFMPLRARRDLMPIDDLMMAVLADKGALLMRLELMRLDCLGQKQPAHPSGPEPDRTNDHCAMLASNLMKAFTLLPITGTAAGPFRVIASLLFEALTGEREVDLKRACDRALRSSLTKVRVEGPNAPNS